MPEAPQSAPARSARGFPLWIKFLLGSAIILMAAGLAMPLLAPEPPAPSGTLSALSSTPSARDDSDLAAWSPAVFRLGFSFFVAFAAAYALRTVFKIALLVVGFAALLLFGLQYAGLVEVKWSAMEVEYDQASSWISTQISSAKAFAMGYLPSGGAAALGFITGFRKGS